MPTLNEPRPEEIIEREIRRIQRDNYRAEYEGASLAKTRLRPGDAQKIECYMREAPQKKKKFLVLSGNPGCGKTYIMSALVGWAYKNFNTKRFFTEEGLFKKLTIGIEQNQAWRDVLQYCIDDEILFLDDLGTNRGNEFHKEVIYVVANTRYSAQTPTVITTNLRRDEVGKIYGERILDRLYSHDSIHLNLDDYPSLRQIDPNTLD